MCVHCTLYAYSYGTPILSKCFFANYIFSVLSRVHGVYSMHYPILEPSVYITNDDKHVPCASMHLRLCVLSAGMLLRYSAAKYRQTSATLYASCWYASPLCWNASEIVHAANLKVCMLRDDIHLQLCMPRAGCVYGTCYVLICISKCECFLHALA